MYKQVEEGDKKAQEDTIRLADGTGRHRNLREGARKYLLAWVQLVIGYRMPSVGSAKGDMFRTRKLRFSQTPRNTLSCVGTRPTPAPEC